MDLMILTWMTLFLLIQLLLSMNINSPFKLLLSINSCLLYFYLKFAVWLVICVYEIKLWRLCPQKVDTEDYIFQNRVVPCNYWVQELVWCAVVVICGCLLVVSVCLLLVCSCMFVVCGCLWWFVVVCWWFLVVCWWFVIICRWFLVVCGGFWLFLVVACFSNSKSIFSISLDLTQLKWHSTARQLIYPTFGFQSFSDLIIPFLHVI